MKKKLIIYTSLLTFVTLFTVILIFISIVNLQYENNLKKQLESNNKVVMSIIKNKNNLDINNIFKSAYESSDLRITIVDNDGVVLYDSVVKSYKMENHNDRKEVVSAKKYGKGFDKRISKSTGIKAIYVANVIDNGEIIRSSISFDKILNFSKDYIKKYIIVVMTVFLITILFSLKLSRLIIKPIKDLDFVSSKIAKGDLNKRVKIVSDDEIGQLGKNFNKMANKLQFSLRDSLEKQNKLEAILKSMDSGVIAIDRKFKVIMINPCAEKIFNLKKDIIGQNLIDCIKNYDIERIMRQSVSESEEIILKYFGGQRVLRVKTTEIINRSEHIGTVAVFQDITDIKELENMRSQFVANVSHELKTPLTSIKGFAETLKDVDDIETQRKFLDIINDEAERLTRLLNDILTLSNIEQSVEIKNEKINVNSVIESIYNLMLNIANKKDMKLYIIGEKVPHLIGDCDRFKQMLINLVDNAIKYSETGGIVTVGTKLKNNNIIIWVQDTGIGIPKEHRQRIFERFYRVDKARSRAKGGTGLGLAIVKHIVLSMNGTINIESEVNVGTKFTIKIPWV